MNFISQFKENYKKQGFPTISSTLLLIGTSFLIKKINPISILKRPDPPKLPEKNTKKPTLIIDYNILINNNFIPEERKYSDLFLFNLSQIYELITINSNPLINSLDPLNCVSFHYFIQDKSKLTNQIINRNNYFCISKSKNNLSKDLQTNCLELLDFKDTQLFLLIDFFTNLYFTNSQLKVINSYKNFFVEFSKIHKKLYFRKYFFKVKDDYEENREVVNKMRVDEYLEVKNGVMDNEKCNYVKKILSYFF